MTDNLQFGAASAQDIPQLCCLLAILFEQEHEFAVNAPRQQTALRLLLAQPQQATILVARQQADIIGMVSLQYSISTALGGSVATLEDLVVDPAYRGQAIGSRLLRYAIDHARQLGCLRITLLTDIDNLAAQCFYARQGFIASSMLPLRLML